MPVTPEYPPTPPVQPTPPMPPTPPVVPIYPTPDPMPTAVVPPPLINDQEPSQGPTVGVAPQAVVRVLSPRGVEYVFMTVALFTGATALVSLLISLVNGATDFGVLEFPVAMLVVALPIFAWLFLRLKKSEVNTPGLRLEPSKRRSTQFIQIASFVVCFFTLIGLITALFAKMSGSLVGTSIIKIILDGLIILVVVGGILTYYWRDEHRA